MWGGGWKVAFRVRVLVFRECCRRISFGGIVFFLLFVFLLEVYNILEEVINIFRYFGFLFGYLKFLGRLIYLNI